MCNCIGVIVITLGSLILKILRNMRSHFFMIQNVAWLTASVPLLGKLRWGNRLYW